VKSGMAPAIVSSLIRRSSTAVNEIVAERLAAKPLAPETAAIGVPMDKISQRVLSGAYSAGWVMGAAHARGDHHRGE
jgi:hypothetical protein